MKLRFVRLFTLITTLLLVQPGIHPVYAQLNVEESLTPEELVDLLIGDGVSVSNISYTGADVAQGRFWGESNLGIDSGLILTSGRATNAIGPITSTGISYNNGASGDPDLTQLANDPTNDASVLEFDFVPQSSNMQFSYVFGSDEYLEFVDSYNDAFGFFISGPGISGTFSNNGINIAVIPGTDNTYVTIDSVNNEDHSEFYYDNPNGQTIEYDGFTKGGMLWPVLRAIAEVTPCSTYHIKLTVGDAVDRALDSGVFLEANSFNAVGVSSTVNFDSPYIDSIAVEDCNSAQIKFSLADHATEDFVLPLTIGGFAQNGIDYDTIPEELIIEQGHKNAYLDIIPFYDTIAEGYETVTITYNTSLCEPNDTTLVIKIYDRPEYIMQAREDTTVHCADSMQLFTLQDGGMPPYLYNWYVSGDTIPFDTAANPDINPFNPTEYIVHQWDACGDTLIDTVFVDVVGPTASVSTDTSICLGDSASLTAGGGFTYLWSPTGDTTATIKVSPPSEKTYIVTVFDECNNSDTDTVTVFVNSPQADAGEDVNICIGESANLTAGGGIEYEWSTGETGQTITVTPDSDECYIVYVTDACDNVASDTVCVFVNDAVVANAGEDQSICYGDTAILAASGGVEYFWNTGEETQSIQVSPATTTTYYVTVSDGCDDTDSVTVFVNPLPELEVQANNDMLCYGDTVLLMASGADEYYWTSEPVDPSLSGQENSPNPLVSPTVPLTTYTLAGTLTATACENTTTIDIQVKEPLLSDYNPEETSLCTGDTISIFYTGNASSGADYDWNFDGAIASGSGQGPYAISWADTGTKVISLKVFEAGCESDSTIKEITVNPTPFVDFTANTTEACVPALFNFYDSSLYTVQDAVYSWDFGNGMNANSMNPQVTYDQAGIYSVSLQVQNGNCQNKKTITDYIRVHDNPEANFSLSPTLTSIKNPEISFTDLSSADAVNWLWDMGDGNIIEDDQNPEYPYQTTGTFNVLLVVENMHGCVDSISKTLTIKPHPNLFAPNAFNPESTQGNDKFVVKATGIEKFNMVIYSRWGEIVFETSNINEGWDGKLNGEIAPMGTYVYRINYTNNLGQIEEVTGTLTLIK